MICCQACSKTSTLDSRFCRACGIELSAEAINAARLAHTELIDSGIGRLAEGRTEEALLIAQEALDQDPASADAYALLGDAHERKGNLSKALDAYEKVVELNPDSPLDRVKLTYLKDTVNKAPAPAKRRPLALISAAATTVLVMSVGSMLAVAANKPTTPINVPADEPISNQMVNSAPQVNRQESKPTQPEQAKPAESEGTTKIEPPLTKDHETTPSERVNRAPIETTDSRPVAPMRVNGPIGTAVPEKQQKPATPARNVGDPDPAPVNSKPAKNNGVIDIRPSEGSESDGQSSTDGANDANNMMRVGRQHFMTGDYERAADAYDRALASGADPALVNQRLAQCYEKLGRKSEAISAYNRAAEAYKRRIENGSGDKARNQAAMDACRAAIRVLGG